ncbi:unnamed protein product [Parnassius mnemosyne]|uniref:Odorant receptor n=1 Tax=Parnassius mnemosyne TaxID=213953 RepID=A0AAV1L4Z9_9NEOP
MSFLKKYFTSKNDVPSFPMSLSSDKSEYDVTYKIPKMAFQLIGIRFTCDDSPFKKSLWNAFYWFEFANIFIVLILEIIAMMLTVSDGSFTVLFTVTPCIGYVLLGMVKSYKFVYYRPVYENLMSELRAMWPQSVDTEEEYNVIRTALTELKVIERGYYYSHAVLMIIFNAPSAISCIRRAFGEEIPRNLIFPYWLPFDPHQCWIFEFIIMTQIWHTFIIICVLLGADLFFFIFLSHITSQFHLLAMRINKLFHVKIDDQLIQEYPLGKYSNDLCKEDIDSISKNEWEAICQKKLVEVILRHRDLIRLSNDVENQFTFPLLINFLVSSILICFCVFCCVFVEKWNEMNYKCFLITATLQISLLCLYGQRLLDASTSVADAVYCSGWYNVPTKIKTSLIILLYRAQKAVYVTTYGFSIVCLPSYATILKTSWSYLMLLVNVFKE